MPVLDKKGHVLPRNCEINTCLPEIDLGCTTGPICCDAPPEPCETVCMPIRARDMIRIAQNEFEHWFQLKDGFSCDINFNFRKVAITIMGTGSCAKTICCFAPAGIDAKGRLLVHWPREFATAHAGYFFMTMQVAGYKPTIFGLYKPWVGLSVYNHAAGSQACDQPVYAGNCMPSCAEAPDVIQESHYPHQPNCGGCNDTC